MEPFERILFTWSLFLLARHSGGRWGQNMEVVRGQSWTCLWFTAVLLHYCTFQIHSSSLGGVQLSRAAKTLELESKYTFRTSETKIKKTGKILHKIFTGIFQEINCHRLVFFFLFFFTPLKNHCRNENKVWRKRRAHSGQSCLSPENMFKLVTSCRGGGCCLLYILELSLSIAVSSSTVLLTNEGASAILMVFN